MSLTPIEEELATILGFDPEICKYIKKNLGGRALERSLRFTDGYDTVEGNGLSVLAPSGDISDFLNRHRAYLLQNSYRPYLADRYGSNNLSNGQELVVLHTDDPYEIVRQRQTSGPNYDVSNEDVIAKLQEWESLCRFEIVQAEPDTLALSLETLPEDLCGFAEDVYAFCPDTVDQGVGNMEEDAYPEVYAAARALCLGHQTEVATPASSHIVPDEEEEFADEFAKSAEMGVKLLAYSIQEGKLIYLWWD
jgi:hypothetical protein